PILFRSQVATSIEHLPAIGHPNEADRTGEKRPRAAKHQLRPITLGKQQLVPLVVAEPRDVLYATVNQMRCRQRTESKRLILQHVQASPLNYEVGSLVGWDVLTHAAAAVVVRVHQMECWYGVLRAEDLEAAVALLFSEESGAIRNNQAKVAGCRGLVH